VSLPYCVSNDAYAKMFRGANDAAGQTVAWPLCGLSRHAQTYHPTDHHLATSCEVWSADNALRQFDVGRTVASQRSAVLAGNWKRASGELGPQGSLYLDDSKQKQGDQSCG